MGNDEKVLSQSEIDALLASSLAKGNAPAAKAPAPPPPPPPSPIKIAVPIPPPKAVVPPLKPAAPVPPPKAAAPVSPPMPANQPAPAPVPAPAPAPQPVVHQGPTTEQVTSLCRKLIAEQTHDLSKQVLELTIKLNELDNLNQKMDRLVESINQVAEMAQSSPQAVMALEAKLGEVYSLVAHVRKHSDEERIHDQFRCVNCHSEKLVAVHVKCTNCGVENWMGWFPDSKEASQGSYQPDLHY